MKKVAFSLPFSSSGRALQETTNPRSIEGNCHGIDQYRGIFAVGGKIACWSRICLSIFSPTISSANQQPRDGCNRNVQVTNERAGGNLKILSYKWRKSHRKCFLLVPGGLAR